MSLAYVEMCDTGNDKTQNSLVRNIAYEILLRQGWRPGERLGVNGIGLLRPLGGIVRVNDGYRSLAASVTILLESQFDSGVICGEGGSMCEFCTKRNRVIYTIFQELDEVDVAGDDYSLPRLPEVCVSLYGKSMNALIDTGSQISGITNELYDTIREQGNVLSEVTIPAIQVHGAFGSRSECTNKLVLIEFKLGSTSVEAPVLVMRRLPRSLILGYDWLERVKGVISCGSERTLTINNLGVQTSVRLESDCEFERMGGALNAAIINSVLAKGIPTIECSSSGVVTTYVSDWKDSLDNVGISEEQRKLLLIVLERHSKVFTTKLGLTNKYEHVIKLTDEQPFVKRSYPVPLGHREQVKEKLDELEELGVIQQEATPFCSPLTYTRKRDGTIRLLLDARELNKRMVGDAGTPPLASEIIQSFHGVNFISLIDCNDAYFQLPLHKDSRKYTGFTFMGKTYTYRVLPQGLKTSVAGFSRAMDIILDDVREFCINYLDDLIVFTTGNLDQHLGHLDQVLDRLERAGMTGRLGKCRFLCVEVKLLGHIVSTTGIQMDPDRKAAIMSFPVPRNIRQLRGFLGLINYFRRFISKYSEEVRPLCDLLKHKLKWTWSNEINECFERVKALFVETVMLHHPNTKETYYLQTDSSNLGVSGYVYQIGTDGDERVIGFCSKSLTVAEQKWTVTEQELWAIIYSLTKFETYLRGARLVIRTDHKSLIFLQSCKLLSARMIRWVHYISRFDYTIEHVKGRDNIVADVLSRHIVGVTDIRTNKTVGPEMNLFQTQLGRKVAQEWKDIINHQSEDRLVREIVSRVRDETTSESKYYVLREGVLYRKDMRGEGLRLYIPERLQRDLITSIHEEIGHFGRYKVYALMRQRYYFVNMSRTIGQVVRACDMCQKSKHALEAHTGPIKTVIATEVGERVFCDIYGPLPAGLYGSKYIFVIQDTYSKYIRLYPLRQASGKASLTCIRKFHAELKIKTLCSDRGTNFISRIFEEGVKGLDIELTHTSVRNPRPNSTERVNKELGRLFRTYCDKSHRSWVGLLPDIEACYNSVTHTTTGYSPNEIVWGKGTSLSTDVDKTKQDKLDYQLETLQQIRQQARENINKVAISREKYYNRNHKLIQFEIGDLVKLKTFAKSDADKKITQKFVRLYEGPYRIGGVPYQNVYTLVDLNTGKVKGNYNAIHLFRYYVNK